MIIQSDEQIAGEILDALPAQIALVGADGTIVCANRAWLNFAKAHNSSETVCGPGIDYLAACDAVVGADAANARAAAAGIRAVLQSDVEHFIAEYPCRSPDAERWFQVRVAPYAGHGATGALVTHTEVTDRRAIEDARRTRDEAAKRVDRVHAALRGINTLILGARNRADLFQEACRIAVEDGGFRMAVILLSGSQDAPMSAAASFGMDDEHRRALVEVLASARAPETMGSPSPDSRSPVVFNDVLNNPNLMLRNHCASSGVRSIAAIPMVLEDRPFGVFLLSAGERDFFRSTELNLLGQLGSNIAFAVDHIEKIDRIKYLAYFDEITGLANRRLFLERVTDRLTAARGSGGKICLILIDLERFKSINDTFGRDAGDSLLRQVADWMTSHTDDETRFARVGPDQFAIVTREFTQREKLNARTRRRPHGVFEASVSNQ